jgi:hypothetical protein
LGVGPEAAVGVPVEPVLGAVDLPVEPFGPEAAALRELDDVLSTVGSLMGRAVGLLDRIVANGAAEKIAGLPVDLWLSQIARQTRVDRNLLLLAVEVLRDMPGLGQALSEGRVAWSQVVRIVYEVRPLRRVQRQELDRLLVDVLDEHRAYAPDDLVTTVTEHVSRLRDRQLERQERAAERGEFLTLMPQLFGGGALYGEFGPQNFATLAEALDSDLPASAPPVDDLDDGDESEALERARDRRRRAQQRGKARAERLLEWAERDLAGTTAAGDVRAPRPTAFVVVDIDTLLGDRVPGDLLTRLSGGRMKVSSGLARRLVDERGADVRLIVLDDLGEVIGVGRKSYQPPGWLREAVWARDLVTSDPTGPAPIRTADLDHVLPWDDGGSTDVTNLTAVSRTAHNLKTTKQLDVTRTRDGTVTWTAPRTGIAVTRPPTRRRLDQPRRPRSTIPKLTDLPPDQLPDPPGDPPNP